MGPEQHAQDYFDQKICHQCALWGTNLEVILAWAEEDSLPNEPTTSKVRKLPRP